MCNYSIIDETDNEETPIYFIDRKPNQNILINLIHHRFHGCCLAMNRKILLCALPFPSTLISHDFWIGMIGICLGRFLFIDIPLHKYRRHSSNVSWLFTEKSTNTFLYKISYRVVFMIQLLIRLFQCRLLKNKLYS
jgi:hypothetical protein